MEHAAHLFADELDQRVEVELAGEGVANTVDRLELGGPSVGLLEETLRFLEQPGVVEGDAHVRGKGR